jgi:hypothetical protein
MKRQLTLIVAVCGGAGLAHIGTSAMPFQIGALMDGAHRTAAQAGAFGFAEIGALALSMILVSARADLLPTRSLALIGGLTAILANIGLFVVGSFPLQLLFGICAGFGYGTIFSATVTAAAATEVPDRMYAIGNGGALLLIVAFMTAIPFGNSRLGAQGVFGSLAILVAVCSPLLLGLRRAELPIVTRLSAWRTPGAAGLLFAWMTASLGTTALYAFSERIGKSILIARRQPGGPRQLEDRRRELRRELPPALGSSRAQFREPDECSLSDPRRSCLSGTRRNGIPAGADRWLGTATSRGRGFLALRGAVRVSESDSLTPARYDVLDAAPSTDGNLYSSSSSWATERFMKHIALRASAPPR